MIPTPHPAPEWIHFSTLKNIARSPLHYDHALKQPFKPTTAMRFGTLLHALLLGVGEYVVWKGKRNTNEWKDFRAGTELEKPGVEIVTLAELAKAKTCAAAIANHHRVRELELLDGGRERPFEWKYLDRKFATRVDIVHPAKRRLVEIKTSASAKPSWFSHQSRKLEYHTQAASSRIGLRENGIDVDEVFCVVVEQKPPHAVQTYRFKERALVRGEKTLRLWTERLLQCEAANYWPAYSEAVEDLDVEDLELDFSGTEDDDEIDVEAA